MVNRTISYRVAGVNRPAAERAKHAMAAIVRRTFTPSVLTDIGQFGAFYRFSGKGLRDPILVSSADSAGTKIKVAVQGRAHDRVAEDLFNHCANDILVHGAKPLFFLDYLAFGKLREDVALQLVKGFARGCRRHGCSLIGGETAELPGMYAPKDYDVAGFIVGVVERGRLIDGHRIKAGDAVIGLASTGLHTNGYSLARHLCFKKAGWSFHRYLPELKMTIGQALLQPHRSYASVVARLRSHVDIRGMAHITGGGLIENIPRVLPPGLGAHISIGRWPVPPLFAMFERLGQLPPSEAYRTFNMGIGFTLMVPAKHAARAIRGAVQSGCKAWNIGTIVHARPGRRLILTHN